MRKNTFVVFGLVVVVLVVLIPWLVFRSDGDPANGAEQVPSSLAEGQSLFQTNCGTCHTLSSAGTDGNYGPNLDELLAANGPPEVDSTKERVLNALENGVDSSTTPGRMPAEILTGPQAKAVAEFVANTVGQE